MLSWIKKLFVFEEQESKSPFPEERKFELVGELDVLLGREDLIEIVNNNMVKTYLLELGFGSTEELVGRVPSMNNNTMFIIPVSDYFDGKLGNVYSTIKTIRNYLYSNSVSSKVLDDVDTIIQMFKFYIE